MVALTSMLEVQTASGSRFTIVHSEELLGEHPARSSWRDFVDLIPPVGWEKTEYSGDVIAHIGFMFSGCHLAQQCCLSTHKPFLRPHGMNVEPCP